MHFNNELKYYYGICKTSIHFISSAVIKCNYFGKLQMDTNKVMVIMWAMVTHAHTHIHKHTQIMFTSTGRSLRAISRRKERRMGEDGKRNERHIEDGGAGGEGWSHEQGEAERRA